MRHALCTSEACLENTVWSLRPVGKIELPWQGCIVCKVTLAADHVWALQHDTNAAARHAPCNLPVLQRTAVPHEPLSQEPDTTNHAQHIQRTFPLQQNGRGPTPTMPIAPPSLPIHAPHAYGLAHNRAPGQGRLRNGRLAPKQAHIGRDAKSITSHVLQPDVWLLSAPLSWLASSQ